MGVRPEHQGSATVPEPIDQEGVGRDVTRAERLRSVFAHMPMTLWANAVNGSLSAVVLAPVAGAAVWAWLVTLLGVTAVRAWLAWRFREVALQSRCRDVLVVGGAACSGVLWGLLGTVPMAGSEMHQMFVAFVIAGMCAGAMAVYSACFVAAASFIVPATLPLAVRFAADGSLLRVTSAVMVVLFAAGLLRAAFMFHGQFGAAVRLQERLSRRTVELDEANAKLRAEMAEHQRAEADLRQAQKMEAVGKLTGGVAHDFNNMLAAISGNLELIAAAADRGEPVGRYVMMAERAADRGAKLVSSLLSFGRRQGLKLEPVDVNALVLDFMPLLRRAAGECSFETRLAAALPDCIADGTHFQSAILNLALNARDATGEGGTIVLESRHVTLGEADVPPGAQARPGPFVAVSVSDTGTGMTPEVREKAFDPFFTTKGPDRGSGLGLSQVYGFARQCGGHATIASVLGHGTTVTIFLPVAPDRSSPAIDGRMSDAVLAGTVLVVDDDADVLAAITRILENAGGDVIAAGSGAEALPILRSDRAIGMLFTDVVMPGISGVELARQARGIRPRLPVLLTSGYAADTLREEGAMDGEFALLAKPVRPADLTACVRAALAEGA